MNLWTKEEIYKILIQLDRMKLPILKTIRLFRKTGN